MKMMVRLQRSHVSPGRRKKRERGVDDVNEAVESSVEELRKQHGSNCTQMQYRIWYNGGVHSSLGEPPTTSMFIHAGSGNKTSQNSSNNHKPLPRLLQHCQLMYITPNSSYAGCGSVPGTSPVKLIDNRFKCYQQLSDLNALKQSGLLSDEEFSAELCKYILY